MSASASRRDDTDRSLARSAWESVPRKNRPVGYGMIGRMYGQRRSRISGFRTQTRCFVLKRNECSGTRKCLPWKELYRRPEIIQHKCFQFSYSKFRHANHRIGAHTCTNHTVPYGTALLGWRCPRHFVPGYDHAVPLGPTPSLHHSITPSLHHSITPSLHHSIDEADDDSNALDTRSGRKEHRTL